MHADLHQMLDGETRGLTLELRPAVLRGLFRFWLANTSADNLGVESHNFRERIYRLRLGGDFGRWLLEEAAAEDDDRKAQFLFREAVATRTTVADPGAPTIEELFEFAEAHQKFQDALHGEIAWPIPEWRTQQAVHRRETEARRRDAREERVRAWAEDLSRIRSARVPGLLSHLGQIYFALFIDVDREAPPRQRLEASTNTEIAEAALEGFAALLLRCDILPTPEQIGESASGSRQYRIGFAVLAGIETVFDASVDELLSLPEATLKAAVAFNYANVTGNQPTWLISLTRERAMLVGEALEQFWRPQVARGVRFISGISDLDREDMAGVARNIAPRVLAEFPICHEDVLRSLLSTALRTCSRDVLLEIFRNVTLPGRLPRGRRRGIWLAAAFACDSNEWQTDLMQYMKGGRERIRDVIAFLFGSTRGLRSRASALPLSAVTALIRIGAPRFPPKELKSGWGRVDGDWEISQALRHLIDRLGGDPTKEASESLFQLQNESGMVEWRETVANAIATQARGRRETEFRYPTIPQVISTLAGGAPSNAVDLQALVVAQLRTLGEDMRHGPTDGYKALWNVDSYARPIRPRPEEDCRDRLLDHLRAKLLVSGVVAEPEGHYASDKRADIKALCGGVNLPVEIKRHYHKDLWSAPIDQLKDLYVRDPGTGGRGVFLVLWFGLKAAPVPTPPHGIPSPTSPVELAAALQKVIPESDRVLIEIVVFDCAPGIA